MGPLHALLQAVPDHVVRQLADDSQHHKVQCITVLLCSYTMQDVVCICGSVHMLLAVLLNKTCCHGHTAIIQHLHTDHTLDVKTSPKARQCHAMHKSDALQ